MKKLNISGFMRKRKLSTLFLVVCCSFALAISSAAIFPEVGLASLFSSSPIGSNTPTDEFLLNYRRSVELSTNLVVPDPTPGTPYTPAERVPRQRFGVFAPFPLDNVQDVTGFIYPSANSEERQAVIEGMAFFTTPHLPVEGAGPVANQQMCLGCHLSSAEATPNSRVARDVSHVSRAARTTPTNFRFTSLDPATGGGRAADNLDAVNNTGRTAAFTVFADFSPSIEASGDRVRSYDPLDGVFVNPVTGVSQPFGGFVQHTRPSLPGACLPEHIPTVTEDRNLVTIDPVTGLGVTGFRRSVGERAGPPYIGRGLMEAIPNNDLLSRADASDAPTLPPGNAPSSTYQGYFSSLNNASFLGCTGDCVTGKANQIPVNANVARGTGFISGLGRFGLRANGGELMQFIIGGLQGEVGFTSLINRSEPVPDAINNPSVRPGCADPYPDTASDASLESHLSVPFGERNFIRMTAPPEFGERLLAVLNNPAQPSQVKRGAELFGIDLVAFANRMIPGRFPAGGDGRNPNAINTSDSLVSCATCHIPVQRTGQSPAVLLGSNDASAVSRHLSYKWAPIFSDLLLHNVPVIDAERFSFRPRDPVVVNRQYQPTLSTEQDATNAVGRTFATYDLSRNFADDAFSNIKAIADGDEFRTAPLMGMGRMGPPFFHDARVFLSRFTFNSNPAGTVYTNSQVTNAPLVVRTLDDAIRAAIELHDLPAPDDSRTPSVPGAGCPVLPVGAVSNVSYGAAPATVICPPYASEVSRTHRSDSREVIRRYRSLSPADQQAMIEFLKEL